MHADAARELRLPVRVDPRRGRTATRAPTTASRASRAREAHRRRSTTSASHSLIASVSEGSLVRHERRIAAATRRPVERM